MVVIIIVDPELVITLSVVLRLTSYVLVSIRGVAVFLICWEIPTES